ncbi:hypothetical protein PR048_020348 [Dryococelus australis]|uniref:Reverse transcriptase Ty1/copia-type domain-containing protein n=1 Tax=Dryococelus australis TaxID=614101 RepID=A0ABQ9H614_9NEOP|nr:hypothetical protein PR048_020348 [Dryococelus australis]
MDAPTVFLNGAVDTDLYIFQPKGVRKGDKVLKFQHDLYGLRESPRCWNQWFNQFATKNDLRSGFDVCLYVGDNLWLIILVDDILLMGEKVKIEQLSAKLTEEFNAKDVGELHCFIGIDQTIAEDRIELSHHKLIDNMLKRFNLQECNGSPSPMEDRPDISEADAMLDVPYRELFDSLAPNIAFATSYLSRFLDPPNSGIVERIIMSVSVCEGYQ